MAEKIKAALAKLDPMEGDHWTEEGLPSLEKVRELSGDAELTREQINEASFGFNREAALELVASGRQDGKAGDDDPLGDAPEPDRPADRRQELQRGVDAAARALQDHEAATIALRKERPALERAHAKALGALHAEFPPPRAANVVQDWVAQQKRRRIERAGTAGAVNPHAPQKAPIDAAFTRRTGYGHKRPPAHLVGTQ